MTKSEWEASGWEAAQLRIAVEYAEKLESMAYGAPQKEFEVSSIEELAAFLIMTPWFGIGRVWKIVNSNSGAKIEMIRSPKTIGWSGHGRTRVTKTEWLSDYGNSQARMSRMDFDRVKSFIYDTWVEIE